MANHLNPNNLMVNLYCLLTQNGSIGSNLKDKWLTKSHLELSDHFTRHDIYDLNLKQLGSRFCIEILMHQIM
jgi:hypothetical protein